MADTRSHALTHGVAVDRTAESATAVLRDWDVHVTTILDDQGEVRVRAHDPRTLDAGVTMLRGNAHRALASRHYMPPPVQATTATLPRRRAWQFAGVGVVIGLLATGGMVFRLATEGTSRVQVVVMPAPAETVTVSAPQTPTLPSHGPEGGAATNPAEGAVLAGVAAPSTAPTFPRAIAAPTGTGSTAKTTTRSPRPSTAGGSGSQATPWGGGTSSETGAAHHPAARPPTSVTIVTSSPSSPTGLGPASCGSAATWTSAGCVSASSTGTPARR